MSKNPDAEKKVVLITGGASESAVQIAHDLIMEKYKVVVTVRDLSLIKKYRKSVERKDTPDFEVLDVTSDSSVRALTDILLEKFGKIDVVINQIGYGLAGPIEETSPEEAQSLFDLNLLGVHRIIRAVLPHMRERKSGLIINQTSEFGSKGIPMLGFYCASKFAIEAYSEALAEEIKSYRIKVCLVQPTAFSSTLSKKIELALQSVSEFSPYYHKTSGVVRELKELKRQDARPEVISSVIKEIIGSQNPRFRYVVGE